jgi:hypothetical protein
MKKVAFVGHCHCFGFAYYFSKLFPDVEVACILPKIYRKDKWYSFVPKSLLIENLIIEDFHEATRYLKDCDHVFTANIGEPECSLYTTDIIRDYLNKNAKLIIITGIMWNKSDTIRKLRLLEHSAKFKNRNIHMSEQIDFDSFFGLWNIVNKFPRSKIMQDYDESLNPTSSWCTPLFYLESLREFCQVYNKPFFDQETYNSLVDNIFPYNHKCLN